MRRVLAFACRAFPPEHHARTSDEVVDTALLAANGSAARGAREALSLVVAGIRQRLRAESSRSLRDGAALLAGVLAILNLAVAVGGITDAIDRPIRVDTPFNPVYAVDWWWIAFVVAGTAVVLGLVLGERLIAVGAALANLGLVGYDAIHLADNSMNDGRGHLDVFTLLRPTLSFPGERQWLSVAVVLALATSAGPPRKLPIKSLLLALAAVALLVLLSRETAGGFLFLRWPLIAIVVLGVALGAVAPRLAVLAVGVTVAAVPSADTYLTMPGYQKGPVTTWLVAVGLALGVLLPLAQLTRRRLT